MDKPKKINRFFSPVKKLLKQFASTDGGDMDVRERSKKEKVRGLSSIGRASSSKENNEIGGGSQREEELPLSNGGGKRFKVHSKPLNDCNAIDHAVVPRKIRSAMIKRNRESLSPPLPDAKKLHHTLNGTQKPRVNSAKKAKQKMVESITITKDEEEVVETLFALARMFPHNKPVKIQVDKKLSEAKSPLPEPIEKPVLASEASKEESTVSQKASTSVEVTNLPSCVEGSASDAVKVNFFTESSVPDRPTIFGNQKSVLGLSSISSQPDCRISHLPKDEQKNVTPLSVAPTSRVSIDPYHVTRSTQGTQHESSFCKQKPELPQVAAIEAKQDDQSIKENKDGGTRLPSCLEGSPALSFVEGNNPNNSGLGLSMVGSHDRAFPGSSKSKVPSWLDSHTSATEPNSIRNDVLKEKVYPVMVDTVRPLKKCATHVHISHLIQGCQSAEKNPRWPLHPDQIKLNGIKIDASAPNSLNGVISLGNKNGLGRVGPVDAGINSGDAEKNMNELRSRIMKDKQSCNFLSLSTGGGSLVSAAPFNDINQGRNKLESSAQLHPYLHPIVQHLSLMPLSINGHSYSPYPDQLTVTAAQQRLKSPQRLGSPFNSSQHQIHGDPAKLHEQQQMWGAHYMPGRNLTASHLSKWQNGKQDSPIYIPCDSNQPLDPSSSSSLRQEIFSDRFPPSMQQQQLLFLSPPSSSSSSRGKMHPHYPHHLPGSHDRGSGRFHVDSSYHLKLVCNGAEQS